MDALQFAAGLLLTTPLAIAAVAGVAWGIIGGAIPGLSSSITMALLLPFTFGMDPMVAITLLASTYVGAEYGGSIPAILIRTPGHGGAAATVIDGYAMHQQGKGGEALGISLIAGVIGGLFGMLLLIVLIRPLASFGLLFTPPAYFSLGVLGLTIVASVTGRSMVKGLLAGCLGVVIATVGTDAMTGVPRFSMRSVELASGIHPILVLMGLFALSEILIQAGLPPWQKISRNTGIRLPDRAMWRRIRRPVVLGSTLGSLEGVTPGGGGTIAAFLAYNEARRWSKKREEFGRGSPEGVAAPEAANNALAATALVPTLSFGVPGSGSTAVLLGGLLVHGIEPGPLLFSRHPEFIYGLYAGLVVANFSQLVLGFLLLRPAIWLVNRPREYLLGFIFVLVFTGVYSLNQSTFELAVLLTSGVAGFLMRRYGYALLPLILGLVLGSMVEQNFRRALLLSAGDYSTFVTDPLSLLLLLVSAAALAYSISQAIRDSRARRESVEKA